MAREVHTSRRQDVNLSDSGFGFLSEWRTCPTHTVAGLCELYEQSLPVRLYTIQKAHTSSSTEVMCRLSGLAPESVLHVLSGCVALAKNK